MKREWKPGDVATGVVTTRGRNRRNLVRTNDDAYPWRVEDEVGGLVAGSVVEDVKARLVVIDPEDREQVERLAKAYTNVHNYSGTPWEDREQVNRDNVCRDLAAAIREFANPSEPKPDEPTGLGAVVEDAGGERWVRSHPEFPASPWSRAHLSGCYSYADIAAVKELAPGWSE